LTEDQIEKVTLHLFKNTEAEKLAEAPGIGLKKAEEFRQALVEDEKPDGSVQTALGNFDSDGDIT